MTNITQVAPVGLLGFSGRRTRATETLEVATVSRPVGRPSGGAGLAELLGVAAGLRLPAAASRLARLPRGDGHVVIDIPGWKAPEVSGAPLRGLLRALGHDARAWGLGVNTGRPEHDAEVLAETVRRTAAEQGPVSLVGWSLGGVIAREVARAHPEAVRRVVTYGTPVIGGPSHTLGAGSFGAAECARITALAEQLDREDPILVPLTAIFTRRDGVVTWQACIDHHSPDVEHVEVFSSHVGMALDPDVWEVVACRLAAPVVRFDSNDQPRGSATTQGCGA
ncbi:MAG: alpha/beta hydrolase [Nocardioidaceae bacterium]